MNASKTAPSSDHNLGARPGWTELGAALDQLHAAELLIGDPLASSATAVPHLREFWRAIAKAGVLAGYGRASAEPDVWLEGEIPGVDGKARQALRAQLERLADPEPPSKRVLRAQVVQARSLVAALEPEIGGTPLRRRRQRILWAIAATVVLLTPVASYIALHAEVPGTGPWRAAYYADKEFDGAPVLVREDSVEHDWKDTAPHEKIAPDKYSVRWDTCLRIDESGPVVFQVNANDGARLLVDGDTVIDAWDRNPKSRKRGFGSAELELEPGVHHLRVEFYESLGAAHIQLSASLDGSVPGPLPRERLSYPGDEFEDDDPCAAVR